jgi:hypothetical protein
VTSPSLTRPSSEGERRRWLLRCIASSIALLGGYALRSRAPEPPGRPSSGTAADAASARGRPPQAAPARGVQRGESVPPDARAAAPERWLRGTVRSWQGSALANAEVCLIAPGSELDAALHCVQSDGAGAYRLLASAEPALVVATAARHGSQSRAVPAAGQLAPIDFVLSREGPATLNGVVSDASGGPVGGAVVLVRRVPGSDLLAATVSDTSGRFSCFVAPGPATVTARAEFYAPASARLEVPAESVMLVLAAGSTLAGQVIDVATARPVGAVIVSATPRSALHPAALQARSDEDGRFEISGLHAADYDLSAVSEGWAGETTSITLGVADVSDGITLRVHAATQVSAVIRSRGTACVGAELMLQAVAPPGPGLRGVTDFGALADEAGQVTLGGLVPGKYTARVACPGAISWTGALEIGTQPVHREWDLEQGASLRGRVERANGEPLAGAHIAIVGRGKAGELPVARVQCRSDDAGAFECGGLTPGEYQISLGGDAVTEPASILIQSGASDPAPLVLRAKPSATLLAHIGAAKSARLGSFQVLARQRDELPVSAVVEADGRARFELALGQYAVYLGPTSSVPRDAPRVLLSADGERVQVELSQPQLLDISGVVLDAAGLPLPDLWVYAESSARDATGAPVGAPALSNEHGEFTLQELIAGSYNIFAGEGRSQRTNDVHAGARDVLLRVLH